jgi:hypothetical protein
MTDEFLGRVAIERHIFEPKSSMILTPPEKDVFSSDSVEKDSHDVDALGVAVLESEEADGGERNDVADLF